jgi:hypothetical protein
VNYTFLNKAPTSFGLRIAPTANSNRTRYDGFYVQDQWTKDRLTLQGALRYEHAWSWAPAGENGVLAPSQFLATPFLFPRTDGVTGYNDITPRMGLAYDVFGNGKTSLKASFSKYLQPANNEANFTIANPAGTYVSFVTRNWTDSNGNFTPDCGPAGLASNTSYDGRATGGDVCQPYSNSLFGNALALTTVNPNVMHGSGVRPYDWQFNVSVQQQILPRVSVDVAFSRRSWGNFFVTDNRAIDNSDYRTVSITAPSNPLLPGGGGYAVPFLVRNANHSLGATDNYYTFASDYGDVKYYWRGVDVTLNARLADGLTIQGGTTTGAGVRDNCAVIAKLPELLNVFGVAQQTTSCAVNEPFLTTLRGLVAYTIPKIDVSLSSSFRSQANIQPDAGGVAVATNGASLNANTNVPAANVPGGLAFGSPFQSVNLILPGALYGDRINAMDLRFGKILKFGRTRTNVALDLYNLFNSNTGTTFQQGYDFASNGSAFRRPTTVLNPRFVRFNVTVDF